MGLRGGKPSFDIGLKIAKVHIPSPGGIAHGNAQHARRPICQGSIEGVNGGFIGKGCHRAAVLQAIGQRLGAEQNRQRHGHCAQKINGHMGDGGFGPLRQDDRNAVAAADSARCQGLRQPSGLLVQIAVAQDFLRAILAVVAHGHSVRSGLRPAHATDLGDVERCQLRPSEMSVQGGVVVGGGAELRRALTMHRRLCAVSGWGCFVALHGVVRLSGH